jgi:adenylate kinase
VVAASAQKAANAVRRVIFLGPPGAGKGTQAVRLAAHLGVPKISTGDMLRTAIAEGTPLGREAEPLLAKGNLAPDAVSTALVRERIAAGDCERGFVLDGFPRTLPQAQLLESMTANGSRDFVVFDFELPRAELVRRLAGRRWCPLCQATFHLESAPPRRAGVCDFDGSPLRQRHDDEEGAIAERLRLYQARTVPVIEHYRARTRMLPIDGNRPKDAVFQDLLAAVEVHA